MELDILRILVILLSVIVMAFLVTGIIAAVFIVRLAKKVSAQLDKAGAISENLISLTAGMSKLGMPVMASKILFGIARKAFSKR